MHSLALISVGTVLAWGDNTFGQVGDGTTTSTLASRIASSNTAPHSASTSESSPKTHRPKGFNVVKRQWIVEAHRLAHAALPTRQPGVL